MKKYIYYILLLCLFLSLSTSANTLTDSTKIQALEYPSSLTNLLKQFKGKIVYIDVMASWCKPCIAELQASKSLNSFFEENDVIKLYITIDQKLDIDKCLTLLNKYDVKGYFISYLPPHKDEVTTFPSDIERLFLKNDKDEFNISIPKYAIVDREGNIVVKRAERPSNKEALIKQLKEWIDKK